MKINKIRSMSLVIFFFGMTLNAQQKKYVTPEDYGKWSYLFMKEISSNGEWVSYGLRYESTIDTLFVKQTETNQEFSFPNSSKGNFSRDGRYFACVTLDKEFSLLDLDQGKIKVTKNIVEYGFSNSGRFLYTLDQNGVLRLIDLMEQRAASRQGIINCIFDPLEKSLGFVAKNTVGVLDLKNFGETRIAYNSSYDYQRLNWHVGGKSLAFLGKSKEGKLEVFFYDVKTKQLLNLIPEKSEQFPDNMKVVSSNSFEISQNGDKVYFDIKLKQNPVKDKDETVQIWYSNDKELFPWKEKRLAQYLFKRSVWIPKKEEFKQLEKKSWSQFIIGPNQKYALAWDIDKYKPSYTYEANADIYLVDLRSGKEKLMLENFGAAFNHWGIHWSPGGRYLSYFKDLHWWVYDIVKQSHSNVTKTLEFPVHDQDYDYSGLVPGYGNPGWSPNDEEILIYDQYDVWAIASNGKSKRKLTNGRERGIVFRFYDKLKEEYPPIGMLRREYDLSNSLVLNMEHHTTKKSGYAIWKAGKIINLVYGDFHVDYLKKASDENYYMFRKQRFELSPQIIVQKGNGVEKVLFQSNPHQKDYYWGRSELIHYLDKNGTPLQGVLIYPANFNPGKSYPLVVNIYERLSYKLHRYRNPSHSSRISFNQTNFNTDNYFILFPDIKFTIDNPGISAVDCVTQAVNSSLRKEVSIDQNRIGLIGHSFGGYLTTFIISQTNLFAAAISLAPVTNLVDFYLGYDENIGKSNTWRYENQQLRFSGPYYTNLKSYLRNSPVHNVNGIETPLLIVFGKEDPQIDWHQGMRLYSALRRSDKNCTLILYPREGHNLYLENNLVDYSNRIKDWFDFYLKTDDKPEWIKIQ